MLVNFVFGGWCVQVKQLFAKGGGISPTLPSKVSFASIKNYELIDVFYCGL